MLESKLTASFGIQFQNSSYIQYSLNRLGELLEYDWEVRPGFLIPQKSYWGWDNTLSIDFSYGNYYSGRRMQISSQFLLQNFANIRTDLDLSYNFVDLLVGNFETKTVGCRIHYFFSTKLYIKAYLQLSDDRKANDNKQITLANVLLRWIYRPGSDFYIVYNETRFISPLAHEIANRTLMLKTTFFWRK